MTVKRFEDLEIWQDSRELSKLVYEITKREGFKHDYKFRDQIRSASGSIMDCIAEGFERDGNKEFSQFLSIAKASCGEVRSQLYRAFDCEYINENELKSLISFAENLSRKIFNLRGYVKSTNLTGTKFKP